jgi:EAL domain-containing protein (putative c-di-GMP-specific phosphodiesterase class I)/GGDEF domain-containing protein
MQVKETNAPMPDLRNPEVSGWFSARIMLVAALVIAVLCTMSRVETSAEGSFSLFWPSAGLGFALLARFGLPGLASAALGVGLWAAVVMHWSLFAVVWTAAASAVGPWLTWRCLPQRFFTVPFPFSRSESLLQFMRAQATGGSVAAALVGSMGLWFTGHWPADVSLLGGTLAYWMIETTGAFLFAPVAWDVLNPSGAASGRRWASRLSQVVRNEWRYGVMVLILTGGVVVLLLLGNSDYARALLYGLLPLLVVVALRASPNWVHVLILASGGVVLMTMAYQERGAPAGGDGTQLLMVALYLLVGTAALQVLLATSSEKRRALEQLERQAFVDAQTRLLNAAGLVRELEAAAAAAANTSAARQLTLISLKLSNAYQAASLADNEELLTLDRQMADQVRKTVAEVRWARIGVGHFQGVWAGAAEDFGAVFSRVGLLTVPLTLDQSSAEKNQDIFRPQWAAAAAQRSLTESAGLSVPVMLAALSQAEARAQQFRRLEVVHVDDRFLVEQQEEAALVEQVRRAIDTRAFLLYAQPIVPNDVKEWGQWQSGKPLVSKFEVLVRMADTQGQTIMPAVFLPAATRAGLMVQLDLAVVEQTIAWLAAHPHALEQIKGCAVNLSGPTVGDARTVEFVRGLFDRYPVPPGILIFEITESMAVTDPEVAAQTLKALRAMGCRVAIDDFGTGVATFDYLKRFEVDFIKIDGTFIRALQDGDLDRVIVESMVNVAQCLGVRTVAEFVSTEALYGLVSTLGIHESQGYALSRPEPIDHWYVAQPGGK